jgi:hypothetical protein
VGLAKAANGKQANSAPSIRSTRASFWSNDSKDDSSRLVPQCSKCSEGTRRCSRSRRISLSGARYRPNMTEDGKGAALNGNGGHGITSRRAHDHIGLSHCGSDKSVCPCRSVAKKQVGKTNPFRYVLFSILSPVDCHGKAHPKRRSMLSQIGESLLIACHQPAGFTRATVVRDRRTQGWRPSRP